MRRSTAVALAALPALLLAGCGSGDPVRGRANPPSGSATPSSPATEAAGATTTPTSTPTQSGGSADPADSRGSGGNANGNGSGSGGSGGGGSAGGTRPTTAPTTSAPDGSAVIASFEVTQQPRCAEGTAVVRAPAVPVIISWRVTGATGVALSVDNPQIVGSYGQYGPQESLELSFPCDGPVGSTVTHTYSITTVGGTGKARSRAISASARVLDDGGGAGQPPPTGGNN